METADALQQVLPNGSNWITVASLVLVAVIVFFRDGLPFLKRKITPTEVKTDLAPADRQLIQEVRQEMRYIRAEVHEMKDGISDLLVMGKVTAALREKGK